MYTINSITWTFCTISFKLAIGLIISKELLRSIALFSIQFLSNLRSIPLFSKELLRSIALFSVQFHSNLRSVPLFQRNYCDRSPYSLYNFRGPAIDRSKFSKELGDRSQNITYKIKTDDTLDSAKIGQFLPFYTHLYSSFLVDSVLFVQTQYGEDMNLLIILIF